MPGHGEEAAAPEPIEMMRPPSAMTLDAARTAAATPPTLMANCRSIWAASSSPTAPVTKTAGVVHEDVEVAEVIDDLAHQLDHLASVGLVRLEGSGAHALSLQLTRHGFRFVGRGYVAKGDVCARPRRGRVRWLRRCRANAGDKERPCLQVSGS